jgi:ABC-type glycerol-3-phosphate transport system substrate-binding protein
MTIEIEFSIMIHRPSEAEHIRPWLDEFENLYNIRVHLIPILWADGTGWMEIANMAIHQHGVDVSEIGTTWVGSLAAMNALRSFDESEIEQLGGSNAYFDVLWKAGILVGDERVWAIPWLSHPLVLYYRHDWLKQIGIEQPQLAFSNESFFSTLDRFVQNGITHPFVLQMTGTSMLHEASMWVWQSGGNFLSEDGRNVLFNQPAALDGLEKYYSLRRYSAITKFNNVYHDSVEVFMGQNAACVIAGPWMALNLPRNNSLLPFSMTRAPGITHVGGSSLVMWQHTRQPEASFALIQFLAHKDTLAQASPHANVLPSRRKAFQKLVDHDPYYQVHQETLLSGRTYPVIRQWGFIEQKLVLALEAIWESVITNPFSDIGDHLHRQLDPLARRLNKALES